MFNKFRLFVVYHHVEKLSNPFARTPPLTLFYIQIVRYDLEEAVATNRPLKKCHVISRDHKPDAVRNGFATLNWLWHEIVQFENIFRFAPEFYMDFSL